MRSKKSLSARWILLSGLMVFCAVLVGPLPVQAVQKWQKTFGGPHDDEAYSVQQTMDGGYIIAGYTTTVENDYPYRDVLLIRASASGKMLWQKTFGDQYSDEEGRCVQQTEDGGYIIVGTSTRPGDVEVYLIKTDNKGDAVWQRKFGGAGWDEGYFVQQTDDGGYIVAGSTNSYGAGGYDAYLLKTDANGKKIWRRTYGGPAHDYGKSVQQIKDGGYILAGATGSYGAGGMDVYLVKTDDRGKRVWQRTFGGQIGDLDVGYSVRQTEEGEYIIAGSINEWGSTSNVYLIHTTQWGKNAWYRTYGDAGGRDTGYCVQQTKDGGYVVAGHRDSNGTSPHGVYLIKTDFFGNNPLEKTFAEGESWNSAASGYSVQQTADGGYIIAGYTWSSARGSKDVYLIKTDVRGNAGDLPQ